MKYSALLFWSLILIQFTAAAQVRCGNLFSSGGDWTPGAQYQAYHGELDANALAKKGFAIGTDGTLTDIASKLYLGKIRTVRTKYLFEWASRPESQHWIRAGGVNYMSDILRADGQVAGKGYYVSLDPFDSANYGDTMTAFRQDGPVLILEARYGSDAQISLGKDTNLVQRLADAGIDALRHSTYDANWISVISERALRHASAFPEDVAQATYNAKYKESSANYKNFLTYASQIPAQTLRRLPADNLMRRFLLVEKLSVEEFSYLLVNNITSVSFRSQALVLRHIEKLMESANTVDKLLALIRSAPDVGSAEKFHNVEKNLPRMTAKKTREIQYHNIFEVYDFKDIIELKTPLAKMKADADQAARNRKNVDFHKINDAVSFKNAVESIYGTKLKWRDANAFVSIAGVQMNLPVETYQPLKADKAMSVLESVPLLGGGTSPRNLKIQYLNFDRADQFSWKFPPEVRANIQQARLTLNASSGNWDSSGVRPAFVELMQQLTTGLINQPVFNAANGAIDSSRLPLILYKQFLRMRPFESGNELAARVLYDLLVRRMTKADAFNSIGFAVEELNLFVDEFDEPQFQMQIQLLKSWVAKSADDDEFQRRGRMAFEVLLRTRSRLRPLFPQLKALNDLGQEIP